MSSTSIHHLEYIYLYARRTALRKMACTSIARQVYLCLKADDTVALESQRQYRSTPDPSCRASMRPRRADPRDSPCAIKSIALYRVIGRRRKHNRANGGSSLRSDRASTLWWLSSGQDQAICQVWPIGLYVCTSKAVITTKLNQSCTYRIVCCHLSETNLLSLITT